KFELNAKVTALSSGAVTYEKNGAEHTIPADKVLLSIGRRPYTEGLGLENIGVETVRGAIPTDEQGRTNIAGVYAAGDVNGKMMLAHMAYREAEVVINTILGKKDRIRYNAIPSVIYTSPEVGSIGLTEDEARAKGMDIAVSNITMKYSGRYVAENDHGDGICKLVVDKKHNRLVGVHMIGSYASEIIWGAAALIEAELRIEDIKELVFPHPTVSEIIREALFEL
ncbi:MAG TPA: FAD-dependent oxidoreductase, partial [Clostridia bacterium]|nr:FAD-dependent oxidoreductase [Clostridia bacterium]